MGVIKVEVVVVPKMRGWLEGVISKDLINGYGSIHKKGSVVRYKRKKSIRDKDGFLLTNYEWHYLDTNNQNLIRTTDRIIEGLPYTKEDYNKSCYPVGLETQIRKYAK